MNVVITPPKVSESITVFTNPRPATTTTTTTTTTTPPPSVPKAPAPSSAPLPAPARPTVTHLALPPARPVDHFRPKRHSARIRSSRSAKTPSVPLEAGDFRNIINTEKTLPDRDLDSVCLGKSDDTSEKRQRGGNGGKSGGMGDKGDKGEKSPNTKHEESSSSSSDSSSSDTDVGNRNNRRPSRHNSRHSRSHEDSDPSSSSDSGSSSSSSGSDYGSEMRRKRSSSSQPAVVVDDPVEKVRLMARLRRRQKMGTVMPTFGPEMSTAQLKEIEETVKYEAQSEQSVQMMKRLVMFGVSMAEGLARYYPDTGLNLDEWSQHVFLTMAQFDETLFEIHDMYLTKTTVNPVVRLGLSLATNAWMYSTSRKVLQETSSGAGLNNIMDDPKLGGILRGMFGASKDDATTASQPTAAKANIAATKPTPAEFVRLHASENTATAHPAHVPVPVTMQPPKAPMFGQEQLLKVLAEAQGRAKQEAKEAKEAKEDTRKVNVTPRNVKHK